MMDETFVQGIAALGARAEENRVLRLPEFPDLAVIDGAVTDLSKYLITPREKSGQAVVIHPGSLIAYVNRHKEPRTEIFASLSALTVTAVIDGNDAGANGMAGWRRHRCTLSLKPYTDWQKWQDGNTRKMSQNEFGEHIESLAHTVEEPDAASLVQLIQKFSYERIVKFARPVYDEQSGAVKIEYEDDLQQKGTMKLPRAIYASASPFMGAKPVKFEAKLRFRPVESGATFAYEILRMDAFREEAFNQVIDEIAKETEIRPLIGP